MIERYLRIPILVAFSVALIGILFWLSADSNTLTDASTRDRAQAWPNIGPPVESQLLELPLTIAASAHVGLGEGDAWSLSVNSAGQAQLVVWTGNGSERTSFDIRSETIRSFRRTLIDNDFFKIETRQHGRFILDGHEATLSVTADNYTQTAHIRNVAHLRDSRGTPQFNETRAAVEAFSAIRSWFEHPSAIDPSGQWTFLLGDESDRD